MLSFRLRLLFHGSYSFGADQGSLDDVVSSLPEEVRGKFGMTMQPTLLARELSVLL